MDDKPQLPPENVAEFVGNAHGDFDKVKELLAKEPALINASWDWGNGDWETALGAAAHVGNTEIAQYLLEHGARIDIFSAAMLGKLEIVKAMIAQFPSMRHAKGPHGIPLLTHAQAGGDKADEVLQFLESE